jgi:hypothetical protein
MDEEQHMRNMEDGEGKKGGERREEMKATMWKESVKKDG